MTDAYESAVKAIAHYFESGAKPNANRIGIELEHILAADADGEPIPYKQTAGDAHGRDRQTGCVANILEALRADYPAETRHGDDLLGVSRPGAAVTIEPAAQLELSAGPFATLDEADAVYRAFEKEVAALAAQEGAHVQAIGYDPKRKAAEKTIIPKDRYKFMNRYLSAISPYGPCMMRASASTQISIDYTDEADAMRKLRLASAASPLFALMTDNAPVFEGARRPHAMMRTKIWNECDPDRCRTVPGALDADFSFRRYAEWILSTPAIVNMAEGEARYDERAFADIFADRPMGEADIEHALSMVFPDVRLKRYIEIRPADSMPVAYALAYAALIKGLFYSDGSLDVLDGLFAGVTVDDVDAAKESLMADDYNATAFGKPAAALCDELVALAANGLSDAERPFLTPLANLVANRTTLADLGGVSDPLADPVM